MPSFDIVSRVDLQELDNAINNARKELGTRFDFRNVPTELVLDKSAKELRILTADEMKLKDVIDLLKTHVIRRKLEVKSMAFGEPEKASQGRVRVTAKIQEGIDKDSAQRIVKLIKARKLKVQAAIQDEQVRVTGKQIDDLQEVIQMLNEEDLPMPLQYVNMKR